MKKKLVSAVLCTAMVASALAGCGSSSSSDASSSDSAAEESADAEESDDAEAETEASTEEAAAEEDVVSNTWGDANGTHLELWTFVEAHGTFYGNMVETWNEENPDNTIELTATTYPYSDMHNKLLMSLNAGTGAPDICDVEVGQFPNVVAGQDTWLVPLNDYMTDYVDTMVTSRLETYAGADGNYYGAPFHVGATLCYYNVAAMSEAMGISTDDVIAKIDSVVTWDDYTALGQEYVDAIATEGKYWTSVDTGGTDYLWLAMAEYGDDWTGGFTDPANVQLDSVKNMLNMENEWLSSGLAEVSPDGHIDLEAGFQNILDHNIVSFCKAAWYMSRFINYMPEEEGNWYLAPCPVFEEGQNRSVGIGGTGTVVTQQSANIDLAATFTCWAKMSEEGEQYIWDNLGFDVCNTALWNQDSFAHDDNNQYNTFFMNYPYDVLDQIKDEIGKISVVAISPTINEQICTYTLNEIFEDGMSVDDALQEAQDAIDLEQ
ncbi:MAG: extracellular solute-binding protein [Lachnospiraceae bacterium]|nr:extracellular solute-binding protein [Lachnospiraceae bacterium]